MKKFFILFIVSSALVLICGCKTVGEARKIQKSAPEHRLPGEYTVSAAAAGIKQDEELPLERLEEIALKYNPEVCQAALKVTLAEFELQDARAGYLPSLTAGAGHTRKTNNTDRHRQSTHHTGSYSGNLSMSVTLFDFGRTSADVKKAQQALMAAQANHKEVCGTVRYNVRKAYFELMRAMELNKVALETVQQYKEHLEQMRSLQEVGEGKPYDVTKAEVDYNEAVLAQITTAHNIETGWSDLNLALGLAETPVYTLGKGTVKHYEDGVAELMNIARSQAPSLATLRYNVTAANAAVDGAIADLYPSLTLSLSGSASGRNPGLPWLWQMSGAASLTQSIYNGGRNLRAIESASIALIQARSSYAAKEQSIYRNLRVALLTNQRARKQFEVAKISEKSAKENLDIVNEQFKLGEASSVDRTDAQVSYSSARAQSVKAYYDFQESHAAIAYLLGE